MDSITSMNLIIILAAVIVIALLVLYLLDSIILQKIIVVATGEVVPLSRIILFQLSEINRVWGDNGTVSSSYKPDLLPELTFLIRYYRLAKFYGHDRDFAFGLSILGLRTALFYQLLQDAKHKTAASNTK